MRRTNLQLMKRRVVALSSAALMAAALTACGSGSSDSSKGAGSKDLTKVSVGLASPDYQNGDVMLAEKLGYFKKYGLDVDIKLLNGSSSLAAAMKAGSIQIGEGDGTASATAILSGIDEVFFGATMKVIPMQMWARKGIDSVSDLRGKKLGAATPGSLTQIATTAVLDQAGMTLDDVQLVHLSNPTAKFAALKSGAIDATLANPPGGDQSASEGTSMIFDASKIPNMSNGYVTMRKFSESDPEVLLSFLKATREAIVDFRNDPAKTKSIVAKYSKQTNPKFQDIGYEFFAPLFTLDPSIEESLLTKSFKNATEAMKKDLSSVDVKSYYYDKAVKQLADEDFVAEMEKKLK